MPEMSLRSLLPEMNLGSSILPALIVRVISVVRFLILRDLIIELLGSSLLLNLNCALTLMLRLLDFFLGDYILVRDSQ